MRRMILVMFVVLEGVGVALAANSLPLRKGDYNSGSCSDRSILTSMGIYRSGNVDSGKQFIAANAEGNAYCYPTTLKIQGNVYSGVAKCDQGTRIPGPTETYIRTPTLFTRVTPLARAGRADTWAHKTPYCGPDEAPSGTVIVTVSSASVPGARRRSARRNDVQLESSFPPRPGAKTKLPRTTLAAAG